MSQTIQPFRVNEKTSARYACVIKDENEVAIPAASLTTLTLTLYDQTSDGIINSRSAQNVLNANGVTVDSSGNLVWVLDPADNLIVGTTVPQNSYERHVALFTYTYNAGRTGRTEVQIAVLNLNKVS